MEKVYVVTNSCVIDYEECPLTPVVFQCLDDAKNYMAEMFDEFLSYGYKWDAREDGELSCFIYMDGEYSCNHWSMQIVECEIK